MVFLTSKDLHRKPGWKNPPAHHFCVNMFHWESQDQKKNGGTVPEK